MLKPANSSVWLVISIFSLAIVNTAFSRTIMVDDEGPADFNNIQAAIDDPNKGDVIELPRGTYTGDGNSDPLLSPKTLFL